MFFNSRLGFTNDLKRGWYNELAYTLPLKKSVLGLSFSDIGINKEISDERFSFPSWRIISVYYSVYFYLRAVTLQKFGGFRLQEHGATITAFKHNLLAPFERVLWKFPFDVAYRPKTRVHRSGLYLANVRHINLKISRHPRPPHNTPLELFEHIRQVFRRRSRANSRPSIYTLFDYMHDFRVWANYLDIDNLLRLWGAGYKSFIDQNLSLLLFFIGGFAEICYMAYFGVDKYIEQLQSIYDLFTGNVKVLERDFIYTPLNHRLEIYNDISTRTELA